MRAGPDPFGVRDSIETSDGKITVYLLKKLEAQGFEGISLLPYSIRILLESLLRHADTDRHVITEEDVEALARWSPENKSLRDIPFIPSRVIMQDFTGVPAVVDIAALRSAMQRLGGDPEKINPVIPADLVIDHSIQVDSYGTAYSLEENEKKEFERNTERYSVLRWAQKAFDNFRVVPPGRGIIHQVNLEYLTPLVHLKENGGEQVAFPDTLVGTDSHTTMINGIGVLGWGVGGIEAEAVMLGQPYYMPVPEVVGFKLYGKLQPGVTATDLVLTITKMLREHGVVGKFVEFYGPGLSSLSLPDRATISNMAPEYGATLGIFPPDSETLDFLKRTGRKKEQVELARKYLEAQDFLYSIHKPEPLFSSTLELDMSTVTACIAGPKRPQDQLFLKEVPRNFRENMRQAFLRKKSAGLELSGDRAYQRWIEEGGSQVEESGTMNQEVEHEKTSLSPKKAFHVTHGSVVIAAITSCTNTSNPSVLLGAGLLAKKAIERGLRAKPYVKTSLSPGSRVVTEYLRAAGLLPYLEALGFHQVGYGCTTCIGNSGPLPPQVAKEVEEKDLTVAAVLSGNRNFEGRINPLVKANYLASPPLVVAYAIAGNVNLDLETEPLALDPNGQPVYLKDIWPGEEEIREASKKISSEMFEKEYSKALEGPELWKKLEAPKGTLYEWNQKSTYIQEPPYFLDFQLTLPPAGNIQGARVLALFGDSITTDHISPAGNIPKESPAGKYLVSWGVDPEAFNSYGSRRGNHEVMMRGTFANIRLRNRLVDREGGWTCYQEETLLEEGAESAESEKWAESGKHVDSEKCAKCVIPIYDAAMLYADAGIPLIVLAGKEYGTGSSRDWAAKGTFLLGVKAVLAESFERIHRSNLVGMGVLPLQFKEGESADSLGLTGKETYDILGLENLEPRGELTVKAKDKTRELDFKVVLRLDSAVEIEYYRNGGILHRFLREKVKEKN
jgi:aconitate hydratase